MPLLVKKLKANWDKLILVIILLLVCITNYTPNTFLIGWDNLMPELNIWLNFKRSLFAVWQQYQGLGLVAGMAHATDLIRQLILLPFTLILPTHLIRYLWHFAMLFLGTFGIFFGLKKSSKFSPLIVLFASLFYLLNFGSIQYFWNPLETFSTFWGFFPWLIFSLWDYLKLPSRSNLIKLAIINLLAIPSFYVQTLFAVYLITVFLILCSYFLTSTKSWKTKANISLKILLLILALNSFWLLPQLYFLSGNLKNPTQGVGNLMSNDQTYQRNTARGNLSDFPLLRGYYYDFPDNNSQLMAPWISHFSNSYILISAYLLSAFVLLGLIRLLFKPRKLNPLSLSVIFLFSLSVLSLLTNAYPLNLINQYLRNFPLVNQIFRSPWTKFIVPAIFSFSLLSAYGISTLISILKQLKYHHQANPLIIPLLATLLLLISSFPVFKGNYISPKRRVDIPSQYHQLFTYLKIQPSSGRIANLPQGSFWGWTNYLWGPSGSGFIWYALPQPILDRAFDAWNLSNEQYYWHLTTAIQKRDPQLLKNVFDQYNIQFAIFDDNIHFPDDKIFSKLSLSLKNLLSQVPGLKLKKQFDNISVFEYKSPTKPYLITSPAIVKPFGFSNQDPVFQLTGDYIISDQAKTIFPFADLFSNRLQSEIPFTVSFDHDNIILTNHNTSSTFPLDYSANQSVSFSPLSHPQTTLITDNEITFHRLNNQNQQNLFTINFPTAKLSKSYLARIEYRHITGLPLEISLVSENSQNKYLTTNLEQKPDWTTAWLVIPARQNFDFDSGLNFIFNNQSFNQAATINDIKSLTLYPFPYSTLISQHNPPIPSSSLNRQYLDSSNHLFWYQIKLQKDNQPNQYLALPQSFDSGWLAFYFNGIKPIFLKNHTLVNNWANAWQIDQNTPNNTSIYILFWPQLLQFLGFALLIPVTIYILKKPKQP